MKTQGKLVKKAEIAHKTFELTIELSSNNFDFKSGQYVGVKPLTTLADSSVPAKIFSMTSKPKDLPLLSFAFRDSASAFKQNLLSSAEFEIEGPYGDFIFPETLENNICFIAGGIGIAPFMSIIRAKTFSSPVTLFYANHNQDNIPYLEELEDRPDILLIKHFGQITETSLKENLNLNTETYFYIAGSLGMVLATEKILTQNNIPKSHLKTEEFLGLE